MAAGGCEPKEYHGRPTTCVRHGGRWLGWWDGCQTSEVLREVQEERARQFAQYGDNATVPDGTGPDAGWLRPVSYIPAHAVETEFREDYEEADAAGRLTWVRLVREEIAEAFKESDESRLQEELIQVAALCVSWVEKIRARNNPNTVKKEN